MFRTEAVHQHMHPDATQCSVFQRCGDTETGRVGFENVTLEMDFVLRRIKGGKQFREKLSAAVE